MPTNSLGPRDLDADRHKRFVPSSALAIEAAGDVEETSDHIVSILEGGRRAFELRGEIYDFPDAGSP